MNLVSMPHYSKGKIHGTLTLMSEVLGHWLEYPVTTNGSECATDDVGMP